MVCVLRGVAPPESPSSQTHRRVRETRSKGSQRRFRPRHMQERGSEAGGAEAE